MTILTPDNRFSTFRRLRQVLPIPEVMFIHIWEAINKFLIIYFEDDASLEYELVHRMCDIFLLH
jgi:hypothetical protein